MTIRKYFKLALGVSAACLIVLGAGVAFSWHHGWHPGRGGPHVGIYFDLTEAFNQALTEQNAGSKNYSNNPSEVYLKQIAVSSEFLVKTNLELIRQQQEIIELLKKQKDTTLKNKNKS